MTIEPSPDPAPGQPIPGWEHFPHVADMGLRGYGATVEQAFAQAALALTATICEPSTIRDTAAVDIRCQASDLESLLVDWLNALVYEMAVRQMLFSRFDVHILGRALQAVAWGEPLDRERHSPAVEVKGATYTELRVRQNEAGVWIAQCVVDV